MSKRRRLVLAPLGILLLGVIALCMHFIFTGISGRPEPYDYKVAYNPSREIFAVLDRNSIAIYDLDFQEISRKPLPTPIRQGWTTFLEWNQEGSQLIFGYLGLVGIFEMANATLRIIPNASIPVAWSGSGNLIAVGNSAMPGETLILSASNLNLLHRLPRFHYGGELQYLDSVRNYAWNTNDTYLALVFSSGVTRVWNMDHAIQLSPTIQNTNQVVFSDENTLLVQTSLNTRLEFWTLNLTILGLANTIYTDFFSSALVVLHQAETIATIESNLIVIRDIHTGSIIRTMSHGDFRVMDMSPAPSVGLVFSIDLLGQVYVWNLNTGVRLTVIDATIDN